MANINTVRIAISRSDGGVSLMDFVIKQHGSSEGGGWERLASPENINAEIVKTGLDCVSWRIIDKSDVPADRSFRNAWKPDLTVDMPKAREIHRNTLRRARGPALAALDIEFMRALEVGDTQKIDLINTQKQKLRDITGNPEIEAAQTPEALKAITL